MRPHEPRSHKAASFETGADSAFPTYCEDGNDQEATSKTSASAASNQKQTTVTPVISPSLSRTQLVGGGSKLVTPSAVRTEATRATLSKFLQKTQSPAGISNTVEHASGHASSDATSDDGGQVSELNATNPTPLSGATLDPPSFVSASDLPEHAGAKYEELVNQASAFGRILEEQNSRLEDLQDKQQILLRENKALKEQLSSSNICACPNVTGIDPNVGKNCDAGGSLASDKQDPNIKLTSFTSNAVNTGAGSHADASEYRGIVLNGLLKSGCDPSEDIVRDLAHFVLNTLVPSLQKTDIIKTRLLKSRRYQSARKTISANNQDQAEQSSSDIPPSIVVRLTSTTMGIISSAIKDLGCYGSRVRFVTSPMSQKDITVDFGE
ncbi:hypothetical protein QAD02_003176 [Eretmocerus hayati]|uniref:Uncharacterized protein n=1 Tax=Eretmocerus hayati TaxID=131215 RepID=A0ACC2NLE3_9HYME|nr:hypothetical protein QAD02_003176 [Eretmocerus hayati]